MLRCYGEEEEWRGVKKVGKRVGVLFWGFVCEIFGECLINLKVFWVLWKKKIKRLFYLKVIYYVGGNLVCWLVGLIIELVLDNLVKWLICLIVLW